MKGDFSLYHRIWTFLNIALVIVSVAYIWIFRPHESLLIIISQLLAQIAIILFFINVNMYFIFLVIRKSPVRSVKLRLAKFSRHMMKWHIKIGITATILIIGHAVINFTQFGPLVGFAHLKLISGYLAIVALFVTLFAGNLRHKKASGFRRKFHLVSAMTFFILFLIHMFIHV